MGAPLGFADKRETQIENERSVNLLSDMLISLLTAGKMWLAEIISQQL